MNELKIKKTLENEYVATYKKCVCILKGIDESSAIFLVMKKAEDRYFIEFAKCIRAENYKNALKDFCKSHGCYATDKDIDNALMRADNMFINMEHNAYQINEIYNSVQAITNLLHISNNDIDDGYEVIDDTDNEDDLNISHLSRITTLTKNDTAKTGNRRGPIKYTNKDRKKPAVRITNEDGKLILDMWKSMTAKEILKKFPMYTLTQINGYCSKHSDIVKRGVSKEFIEELKSYNGTKTIRELSKIYGNRNLKRLCDNHKIPYRKA